MVCPHKLRKPSFSFIETNVKKGCPWDICLQLLQPSLLSLTTPYCLAEANPGFPHGTGNLSRHFSYLHAGEPTLLPKTSAWAL